MMYASLRIRDAKWLLQSLLPILLQDATRLLSQHNIVYSNLSNLNSSVLQQHTFTVPDL